MNFRSGIILVCKSSRESIREVYCRYEDVIKLSPGESCRRTSRFFILRWRVVSSISSTETSNEGSSVKKRKKQHNKKRFLTGRQVSWMICEYFTFSDTDESVLDLSEFKKVEWKNNIQSFDALWDETRIATKKQPDEEILEIFVNIVSFVVHCKVQFNKVHRESASDFKKMVVRHLDHNIREKHFSDLEKPATASTAAKGRTTKRSVLSRRSVWE